MIGESCSCITIDPEDALTVCSVTHQSTDYLLLNWALTKRLNSVNPKQWIVVENSPPDSGGRLTGQSSPFFVVDGCDYDPSTPPRPSYHHGLALNQALGFVQTRFVLVLDPDFFIVRPEWIQGVLRHMRSHGLAFFGVPWHPRRPIKYRYFPCVHCLFIDLEQTGADFLDFSPETRSGGRWSLLCRSLRALSFRRQARRDFSLLTLSARRNTIGVSRDTGYRLFRAFGNERESPQQCVLPVFLPERDLAPVLTWWPNRMAEKLLPDNLCYVPKRRGYFTKTGFRALGNFDAAAVDWEEFVWQGSPFGFHVRRYGRQVCDQKELDLLGPALDSFAAS